MMWLRYSNTSVVELYQQQQQLCAFDGVIYSADVCKAEGVCG
jgi:hypothetical protein